MADRDPDSMAEAEAHVRALLGYIGDDPEREGLLDTPGRVVRAFDEHFRGYREDPHAHLETTFGDTNGYDELVLVSDIQVHSHCEHHMVPFVGQAHVAYVPKDRIVGLSQLARVVDTYAKRLHRGGAPAAGRGGHHPVSALLHVLPGRPEAGELDDDQQAPRPLPARRGGPHGALHAHRDAPRDPVEPGAGA